MKRRSFFAILLLAALPMLVAWAISPNPNRPSTRPLIPLANRSTDQRVFLDRADILTKNPNDSFMMLIGNVVFTKGGMIMKCDSCHYYSETESMNAFGNVSMEQGDTLFVYADELDYDGIAEIATLYANPGRKVELINRDVKLETDIFVYDMAIELGYYEVGGKLTDPNNTLTSLKGEYAPNTKEANFYIDVHLNSRDSKDTLDIYTDTLLYNTNTKIARLYSPSKVINDRGTIFTSLGIYDTDSSATTLFDRSTIVTKQGQTLTADTIFYDRLAGFGEAFGNMILTDSAHNAEIRGQFGFYDEINDSSFVTGNAQLREYSQGDTLYLHGKYIQSFRRIDSTFIDADTILGTPETIRLDTTHVAVVYPRVRFFRSDMQGICDSMRFEQKDTMLHMLINPVVWSENRQIFGNIIDLKLNDSTIERAILPDWGFSAEHIEGPHYNQISGKKMTAYFKNGEMRQLDIDGNVEIIMYPEENDSTINKIVNAESSFLQALFKGRTTEKIKMWPESKGTVTPLFISKKSQYLLPKFKWFDGVGPDSPESIFTVPQEMEDMMSENGRKPPYIKIKPKSRLHQMF